MINSIPESWTYSSDLEMLLLFYQATDELLSEITPDTYALPLHNSVTIVDEINEVYQYLKECNCLDKYYANYIPPIIDELFSKIEEDFLLKKILDKRLNSILTGFREAKENHILIERWVDAFKQACTNEEYRKAYQEEIIKLVNKTMEKDKLLYSIKNYYVSLIKVGYSREYIYTTSKKFFNNRAVKITRKNQINEFLEKFDCNSREFKFLVLMDMDNIDYLNSINSKFSFGHHIQKIDVEAERENLCKDIAVSELVNEYDKKIRSSSAYQKIAIVKIIDKELDPYKSAMKFCEYISFLQTFKRYFIHHNYVKQVYSFLLQRIDGTYVKLEIPKKLKKRPYIEQSLIDSRIENILTAKSLGRDALLSLAKALEMHAEAFDSKNTVTLFRSLWTALETLFLNPNSSSTSESAMSGVLAIIQKTYILKILRGIYSQLKCAIETTALKDMKITSFSDFVEYFASYSNDSTEMKRIYNCLSENPLLRSRLFKLRKSLDDGKHIAILIDNHNKQIEWQLKRLYRIRNIATHLGIEMNGAEISLNHLHNYFDYVVNYMLCKSENGDYVFSVPSLAFESKNDTRIHRELLKDNKPLSKDNYKYYLFGPDVKIINYKFEH